jgi:hypothetical protein
MTIGSEGGTPLRHKADRPGSGQAGHDVGPCPRGVDDVGGRDTLAVAETDLPRAVPALERHDLGVETQHAARRARALEEAAMDRRHVHVLGFLEDGAARRRRRFQQRMAAESLGRIEPTHAGYQARIVGGRLLHRRLLLGPPGDQRAARRQQRMVGEAGRRLAIKAARCHRDGANLRTAIGL